MIIQVNLALVAIILILMFLMLKALTIKSTRILMNIKFKKFWFKFTRSTYETD